MVRQALNLKQAVLFIDFDIPSPRVLIELAAQSVHARGHFAFVPSDKRKLRLFKVYS